LFFAAPIHSSATHALFLRPALHTTTEENVMKRTIASLLASLAAGAAFAQAPAPATPPATPPAASPTAPPPPAFAAPNLTPGGVRSLAANCAACHGTNGASAGGAIAGLAGMNKEYFVNQMKLFKEGKREATLMHQIAKGYSDAETAALAAYFSEQKK
jgi:cytochrome subunit of sulfide dehydrogenase